MQPQPIAPIAGLAARTAGAGEPLVLLHGGMGSWNHWTRNIDALARRYTLYLLDLPGFGDSYTVPKDMPDHEYVDLVAHAVEEIASARPVNLAGFSFGGMIAAHVAALPGARMHKVSLLGVGGFGGSTRTLEMRKIPPDHSGAAAVRDVLRHNLEVLMIADPARVTDETIDLHHANVRRTRFDGRRFSLGNDMPEILPRIACPVQIIWGTRDPLPYPDVETRARTALAARADLRVDLVAGAGHWVQYEAPETVNELMLGFFDDAANRERT